MRSTVGRQLNSKAERWYHGEGRRQERKHGATASPEFLTGDLTGAGDPLHGTPLLSSQQSDPGASHIARLGKQRRLAIRAERAGSHQRTVQLSATSLGRQTASGLPQ